GLLRPITLTWVFGRSCATTAVASAALRQRAKMVRSSIAFSPMAAASSHLCRCAATWRAPFEPPRRSARATAGNIAPQSTNCALGGPMMGPLIDPHPAASSGIVRVETVRIKPKQGPGPAHVLRQRRGDVDRATRYGMRNDKAARMEVQLGFDPAVGQDLVALVLAVADDGVADQSHMRTQLVLATGDGLQ